VMHLTVDVAKVGTASLGRPLNPARPADAPYRPDKK